MLIVWYDQHLSLFPLNDILLIYVLLKDVLFCICLYRVYTVHDCIIIEEWGCLLFLIFESLEPMFSHILYRMGIMTRNKRRGGIGASE